ncbi:uncharacterized protein LAESUDRAFT_374260 [Laetiporus sulphureus 93-53]|uniref:Uncharacterized protein n=1 Tax=Laetiporus sulphureus 93-53 TaxID=1314785 RepID=A0A165CNH7_9APHY|nr:uncharacterized protein LAESUDRAFT_374260 [Laetiporus sulphureus 93-53]KZT03131.1 hypothetical protein LAESUDRAFT_374260 [Laetiporus sulphureus 93-53]
MNKKAAVHNTPSSSLHFRMYSRPLRVHPFKLSDIVPDAELLATLEAGEQLVAKAAAMIRFRVCTVPALATTLNFICLFGSTTSFSIAKHSYSGWIWPFTSQRCVISNSLRI